MSNKDANKPKMRSYSWKEAVQDKDVMFFDDEGNRLTIREVDTFRFAQAEIQFPHGEGQWVNSYFLKFWSVVLGDETAMFFLKLLDRYVFGSKDHCFPSIPRISKEFNISLNTVRNRLRTLEQHCFVRKFIPKNITTNQAFSGLIKIRRDIPVIPSAQLLPEHLWNEHETYLQRVAEPITLLEEEEFPEKTNNKGVKKGGTSKLEGGVLQNLKEGVLQNLNPNLSLNNNLYINNKELYIQQHNYKDIKNTASSPVCQEEISEKEKDVVVVFPSEKISPKKLDLNLQKILELCNELIPESRPDKQQILMNPEISKRLESHAAKSIAKETGLASSKKVDASQVLDRVQQAILAVVEFASENPVDNLPGLLINAIKTGMKPSTKDKCGAPLLKTAPPKPSKYDVLRERS